MKNIKLIIAIGLLIPTMLTSFNGTAQSDEDALRISLLGYGSTARSAAVGGAFGALGGDFGALSINPAGMGVYRGSELSITTNFNSTQISSSFLGTDLDENTKYNFNVNHFAIILAGKSRKKKNGWQSGGVAFGMNRLADFYGQSFAAGYNSQHSLLDAYLEQVNANGGTNPYSVYNSDPFGAGLAYETYLINPISADTNMFNSVIPNGMVEQQLAMSTKGSVNEFLFSAGANYNNKVFIGGNIGIPTVSYRETATYTEVDRDDVIDGFSDFTLTDEFTTNGMGINFKIGMIAQPIPMVRLGASFHSPTWFSMNDEYSSDMIANLDSSIDLSYSSPYGSYSYLLVTPWRVNASAAVVKKGMGFVSLDYEFTDHSKSYFEFDSWGETGDKVTENEVNQNISTKYAGSHAIRIGGEYAYEVFRFRAGYGMRTSPFNSGILVNGEKDQSEQTISGGIGLREKHFFIDFTMNKKISEFSVQPYSLNSTSVQAINYGKGSTNFMLTMGLKF